jgi:membrane associated rhomboid family serine protease
VLAKQLLIDKRSEEFMRVLMILGGLIGFLIGICLGAAQGSALPKILWRASIAAFLSGVVLRWWGKVWLNSLRKEIRERSMPIQQQPNAK